MPHLDCSGTDGFTRIIELREGDEVSIGRSPENTLTEGGSALSRRHAIVSLHAGLAFVQDLDSSNGTYLNGDEVHRPQVLAHGDVVRCGELDMKYVEG